jgi:hypothetical protein
MAVMTLTPVILRHLTTGRYLAPGGHWTTDIGLAVRFPDEEEARLFLQVYACERRAFGLVRT